MIDAVWWTVTEAKRADAMQVQLFDHFAGLGHDLRARRWQIGLNPVYPNQGKGSENPIWTSVLFDPASLY